VGGILLNRNLDFIDTINTLVYQRKNTAEDPRGTATLFLEDVRISTNVRLFENVRALGTRVSAEVRSAVLDDGQTWLDRAFVVNDWYISGYLPIYDSFERRIGMLYVGFLEEPFRLVKRDAIAMMWIAFIGILLVFIPVFLRLAGGIFSPLERMTQTMRRVETGDLAARNNLNRTGGEIAEVSQHLDHLLDQVQERDKQLREWADDLNIRVEERTAQLQEANQKLETTYQQLVMSEKLASIGEITAGVAHEINNPVAVIQGNVDVVRLTLGEQAEPVKTELDLIDRQIMRIGGIVGKLLQFARPDDYGKYEEYVNLRDVTQDSLGLVDHVYASKDIDVHLDLAHIPDVKINPSELQQVIINLIINAVQAMDGKGTLIIRTHPSERGGKQGVCLAFQDSGPGISEDTINTIFDPFFTTKRAKGTGLGLSISQTIIQTAGGIITAENHPEGGALMSIWLPV
jgi:two-component system NtrC family sensor kinase